MRIIELIPNLQVGGAERFVVDLSNSLSKKGNDVILVTLYDKSPDHVFEKELSNVRRIELHKSRGFDIRCLWDVLKLIRIERPDIVHVHGEAVKYLILAVLMYKRTRYFATIHSDAKYDSGRGFGLLVRFILYKLQLVHPITISKASQDSFFDLFRINPPLIENGCTKYFINNNSIPNFRSDVDYLFIHVASIQKVKNQIALVKAFEQLLNKGIKARLLFLGRIHDETIYADLKEHWSESIMYLGQLTNVRDYMFQADAFCLSSTVEGMPITVIEALSVGCPCLVTPAGGCVNLIRDGVNGFIAESYSAESFLELFERFISLSTRDRNIMRNSAKQSFDEHYSIDVTTDKYLSLFVS